MSLRTLLSHSSHFFGGNVIGLVLSLISFPILTRLLRQDQYGVMVLVNATAAMAVAVAKGGTSEAIVRFYAEYANTPARLRTFTSTVIVTRIAQAGLTTIVYLAALPLVFHSLELPTAQMWPFLVMAAYIFIRPMSIVPLNYFRAVGLTVKYNVVGVIAKASSIVLSVGVLVVVARSLTAYFSVTVLVEATTTAALMWWLLKNYEFSTSSVSRELARTLVTFGLPLAATEIGYLLLQYANRYLLAGFRGSDELAVYAVGYNVPSYMNDAIMFALSYAIVPIYTNIFTTQGAVAVGNFLNRTLYYYIGGVILACAGYAAVADDLIRWLASEKYARSASFSPIILLSLLVLGSNNITYAGLYLYKRTRTIMMIMVGSLVVNIGINLILIPRFGAAGAAIATLAACLASVAATVAVSRKLIPIRINVGAVGYYAIGGLALSFLVSRITTGHPSLNLGLKLAMGAAIVGIVVLGREAELRGEVMRRLRFLLDRR